MKAIIDHVLKTRWNDPWADEHYYLWGDGLTPPQGSFIHNTVFFEQLPRPNVGNVRCWTFMMGKVPDWVLGLSIPTQVWVSLNSVCINGQLLRAYWPTGKMVALEDTLVYQNYDGVMYVVVVNNSLSPTTVDDTRPCKLVLINFSGEGVDALVQNGLITYAKETNATQVTVRTNNEFATLKSALTNKPNALVFQNGYLTQLWSSYTEDANGVYTLLEDASIVQVKTHTLSNCTTYTSQRDFGAKKAILPLTMLLWELVYPTDLEVYWSVTPVPNTPFKAVRILDPKCLRLITPGHVSLNLDTLAALSGLNPLTLVVYVVERQNGRLLNRTGTTDYVADFMRLPNYRWSPVLSGTYNKVSFWSAPALENSSVYRLMDLPIQKLTAVDCFDALSHSGVVEALIPKPQLISTPRVDQGLGVSDRKRNDYIPVSTAIIIDANGRLYKESLSPLERYASLTTPNIAYPAWVRIVPFEVHCLPNDTQPWLYSLDGSYIGKTVSTPDLASYGFKAYIRPIVEGLLVGSWEEVNQSSGWFDYLSAGDVVSDFVPVLRWNPQLTNNFATLVRIPHTALIQDALKPNTILNGLVDQGIWDVYAVDAPDTMCPDGLGYGSFTIYLGGRVLTPFVDYVLHTDRVGFVIHTMRSTTHVMGSVKPLVVVAYGYPNDPKQQDYGIVEWGFVKDGVMSKDRRYAPVTEQRTLTVVGGLPSVIKDDSSVDAQLNLHHQDEGKAYVKFQEPYPIEIYGGVTTHALSVEKTVRDSVIDFCSTAIPQSTLVSPSLLGTRHRVVSFLCCRLLNEIDRGNVSLTNLRRFGTWDERLLTAWIGGFSRELSLDICLQPGLEWQYFEAWAHPYDTVSELTTFTQLEGDVLGVDHLTFSLIEYVSTNYLLGRLDPSSSLMIV